MRRGIVILLAALLLFVSAYAQTYDIVTETGANGTLEFPRLKDPVLDEALEQRLGIAEARRLLGSGAALTGKTTAYAFTAAGRTLLSLCFDVRGDIRFGRFDARSKAVLIDTDLGEILTPSSIFPDADAVQHFLDAYAEDHVLDTLNTYLDAAELLPVPMENISYDEFGLTVHYPSERFRFLSGLNGAISVAYYELAPLLPAEVYVLPDRAEVWNAAASGVLYGIPLRVGDSLHAVRTEQGVLGEPDYITGGEIYEMEASALRGVQVIAARGAETDAQAQIDAVRAWRFDISGVRPGTTREQAAAVLGTPQEHRFLSPDEAEGLRLQAGEVEHYTAGAFTLSLYYDADACAYAAELGRTE